MVNRGFPITAWKVGDIQIQNFFTHPDHHTPPWQYLTASQEQKCEQDYCGELEEKNHLEDLGGI